MKKIRYYLAILILALVSVQAFAYGNQSREQALFLTDKMAYELGLNPRQYADVFEINYDFILRADQLKYDILRGNSFAVDQYYQLLNYRNEDIYWVLNSSQYRRFSGRNYFSRPIYVNGGGWGLRVSINYTNRNHYYYEPPVNYRSYRGRGYRHLSNEYYYRDRYNRGSSRSYQSVYSNSRNYNKMRREDFDYRSERTNRNQYNSRNTTRNNNSRNQYNTNSRSTRVPRREDAPQRSTNSENSRNTSRQSTRTTMPNVQTLSNTTEANQSRSVRGRSESQRTTRSSTRIVNDRASAPRKENVQRVSRNRSTRSNESTRSVRTR